MRRVASHWLPCRGEVVEYVCRMEWWMGTSTVKWNATPSRVIWSVVVTGETFNRQELNAVKMFIDWVYEIVVWPSTEFQTATRQLLCWLIVLLRGLARVRLSSWSLWRTPGICLTHHKHLDTCANFRIFTPRQESWDLQWAEIWPPDTARFKVKLFVIQQLHLFLVLFIFTLYYYFGNLEKMYS